MPDLATRDIICIGASSGGVSALTRLVADLPASLNAAVFIVLHTRRGSPGTLAAILGRHAAMPVETASHDEPIVKGRIRVAPADHHLVLTASRTLLDRGPTENRVRPAVDTLFRSAAVSCGARVISVVLTGHLADGSAGSRAVQRAGGIVVVQAPDDAECPSMPRAAISAAVPDHVVPLSAIGAVLTRLAGTATPSIAVPEDLVLEMEAGMRLGESSVAINDQLGEQAPFTCPDCGGPLWRLSDPTRFRCQVGHAYHDDVLVDAQAQASTQALWVAARTLDERARLLFDMARRHRDQSHVLSAASYHARAQEVSGAAREIRRLLGAVPTTPDDPSSTEDS